MSLSLPARRPRYPGPGRRQPFAARVVPLALGLLSASVPAEAPIDFKHLPALQSPVVTDSLMLAVARAGDRLVAVGEQGFVAFSDDAGRSWSQASVPLSVTLTTVEFVDVQRGWAGGHEGMLLATVDGGASWSRRFDGVEATEQEIALAEESVAAARESLAALGEDGDREEASLLLEDAEWVLEDLRTTLEEGPSNPFLDIWFDGRERGIAAGAYGYLFRTRDGGETWRLAARDIENPDKYHYYGVEEAADGTLYLVGEAGLLYRSRDRGDTRTTLDSPYGGSFFGVLTGTAGEQGFVLVFGLRGNIFRSVDAGERWERIEAGTQASLMAGTTMPDGRIVVVGNSGAVLVSEDHGRSFSARYRDDRQSLSGVAVADDAHVVVVGAGGIHRMALPEPGR